MTDNFETDDNEIEQTQGEFEESPSFVQLAVDKKPTEFADAITTSLYDRVKDAIDGMRSNVAAGIFNKTESD
jgi:hypothetical protein